MLDTNFFSKLVKNIRYGALSKIQETWDEIKEELTVGTIESLRAAYKSSFYSRISDGILMTLKGVSVTSSGAALIKTLSDLESLLVHTCRHKQ